MFYKLRIEGWFDFDPSQVELINIAYEMTEGIAICTLSEVVKKVENSSEIDDEGAKSFLGEIK